MNSQLFRTVCRVMPLALGLFSATSCKKVLDVTPETSVSSENAYRNVYDADAAVWGVYGKFMNLGQRWMLLNELRADLLEYTPNADEYMRQLSNHTVTADNPYINPQPFYDVILNINDVMKNLAIMLRDKKLKEAEYNQRFADMTALRAWVYLQLGIHYGSVPYITDPLEQEDDLHNPSKFPKITFSQLLDQLINSMEAVKANLADYPTASSLYVTVDAYSSQKFFINKSIMLAELYLWRGKGSDYLQAASYYKNIMESGTGNSNIDIAFNSYRMAYNADVTNYNTVAMAYTRGRESDRNALIDDDSRGWRSIFTRAVTDSRYNWEMIWALPYDKNFQPGNPFIDLFSPVGGRYLVKPSQAAIDNWNSQVQFNNFPYDARAQLTYRTINGQPVVYKYLYNYLSTTGVPITGLLDRSGKWFLYRAATMHLHYAEAANRDGKHKIGYAIVNNGINSVFDDASQTDKTNLQRTFDPFPYDFMARSGGSPGPVFTDPWYRGVGVRGRAGVKALPLVGDSTLAVEDMAINEGALELAYEGQRWGDLLRIALRRNDPSYIANKVYAKLTKDGVPGAEAARAKLLGGNYYLPFQW